MANELRQELGNRKLAGRERVLGSMERIKRDSREKLRKVIRKKLRGTEGEETNQRKTQNNVSGLNMLRVSWGMSQGLWPRHLLVNN